MALQDMFRDLGTDMQTYKEAYLLAQQELEKIQDMSKEELIKLQQKYGSLSAKGQAIAQLIATKKE